MQLPLSVLVSIGIVCFHVYAAPTTDHASIKVNLGYTIQQGTVEVSFHDHQVYGSTSLSLTIIY